MIELPHAVTRKAELAGQDGWLAELPSLVAHFAQRWQLTIGGTFPDASEAFVAEAVRADGTPAVLKLLVPRGDGVAANEITTLRLAGGEGCVRLLDHDADAGALLVERLGPSLHDLGVPMRRRHEILTDLAARLWRPAPDSGLPTGIDKGRWLVDYITTTWDALDRPCSERAVDHALECARRRMAAHDDERARLVHGDVHQWNALQCGDGFALVDPDGLLVEPEYDLGVLMREDPAELLRDGPRERAAWLAKRTGLDADAVWEWGVVERVSTALVLTSLAIEPMGRDMLAAADAIAAER